MDTKNIEGMNEFEIELELNDIKAIHPSINDESPLLYAILLEKCKDKLAEHQIEYIKQQINNLVMKERFIQMKWKEKMYNGEVLTFDEKLNLMSTQIIRVDN